MIKNLLFVGLCFCSITAIAQDTPSAARIVVYKWVDGHVTHYSTQPPHGVMNVVKLDERGLVIRGDDENLDIYSKVKPVRPDNEEQVQANSTKADANDGEKSEPLPEGAITKEERCSEAQSQIEILESTPLDEPINIEDDNGNLLPMNQDERNERLQSAKALVERICN